MPCDPTLIWYVCGEADNHHFPTFFNEKLAAEKWARFLFPRDAIDKRYTRIHSLEVWTIDTIDTIDDTP